VTYYCYNDIWYRPFGGYYVVCRPPFGTVLAADLIADIAWTAVRISYYNTVADTFRTINENNEYIARQNEIIAQNNAVMAAQNQTIAMNQQLAAQAYGLADELGLVQSYAAADSEYYYQDGVFYVQNKNGEYKVIVPPAGALVEALPDDFDMVTLNGEEYYKVDDTVYRVTVAEGKPYFEVLGQMYS
jgi:kynureninase